MSKVRTALKFSLGATYVGKLLNLLTVVIIARILTPDELGVYAIAAALVMVVDVLKSFGVSSYIIKKETLTTNDVRSSLGLNVIITSTLGFGILILAKPLEHFYEYEDVAILLALLSISFFVSPFYGNGIALLSREFKFKERLQIYLISQVFEFIVMIALILLGFSYFSMAIAVAMKSLLQVLLVKLYQPNNMCWIPSFIGMKPIAKFGVFVTFANLFERLTIISSDLIIGKLGTPGMVAYFSRGVGFIDFLTATISEGISPVTMPYLAEKKRLGHNIEIAYYEASKLLGAMLLPVLIVAGVASYPVIMLFFGEQWVKSAELVSILCLWGVARNVHALSPILLITVGAEKHLCFRNLIMFSLTACSVYFAFPYGLNAIATGVTIVAFINFIYTTLLLKIILGFSLTKFTSSFLPNIILCLTCFGAAYLISQLIDFKQATIMYSFIVLIPIVTLTWLVTLWITKHTLLDELKRLFGVKNEF